MVKRSFQDDLDRRNAAGTREREQAASRAAYERKLDYQQGEAVAADIAGRVARYGRDAASSVATLEGAARHQHDGLAGRVAAARLLDHAINYRQRAITDAERDKFDGVARALNDAVRQQMLESREHERER